MFWKIKKTLAKLLSVWGKNRLRLEFLRKLFWVFKGNKLKIDALIILIDCMRKFSFSIGLENNTIFLHQFFCLG